jgi:hypothetical protein
MLAGCGLMGSRNEQQLCRCAKCPPLFLRTWFKLGNLFDGM